MALFLSNPAKLPYYSIIYSQNLEKTSIFHYIFLLSRLRLGAGRIQFSCLAINCFREEEVIINQ